MTTFMSSPLRALRVMARPGREVLLSLWLGALAMASLGLSAPDTTAQFTQGDIPITGPVPVSPSEVNTFDDLDAEITQLMADKQVTAATVGIQKNGRIMYQRGFGWKDYHGGDLTPVTPTSLMRVASVGRLFTAAAIVHLIDTGVISGSDRVFTYDQPPGVGILPASPYSPHNGTLGDGRIKDITVEHLLLHWGGISSGDPMFSAVAVANDLGVPSPPGQVNTVKWWMANQLDYTPGSPPGTYVESDFGFVLLGLIIEEVTGMDQLDYIRSHLSSQWGGTPEELQHGRTFKLDQHPSEPVYESTVTAPNVFYPAIGPAVVPSQYGGWDHESLAGTGGLVTNTLQLLHYLDRYVAATIHLNPITAVIGDPLPAFAVETFHFGVLDGTRAIAFQTGDIAIAIISNEREPDVDALSEAVLAKTFQWLSSSNPWPTTYATDNWVDFDTGSGNGKFSLPENNMEHGLALAQTGGTVKFKPSTTDWTGPINQAVVLSAPLGPVTIGQN